MGSSDLRYIAGKKYFRPGRKGMVNRGDYEW
jgi:hypothetical protein